MVLHRTGGDVTLEKIMQLLNLSSNQTMCKESPAQQYTPPYPPLEQVTKPNLVTAEMAYYANQSEQTWRAHACRETYPEGLRPHRIGGRLNWPTAGAKKLLGVK